MPSREYYFKDGALQEGFEFKAYVTLTKDGQSYAQEFQCSEELISLVYTSDRAFILTLNGMGEYLAQGYTAEVSSLVLSETGVECWGEDLTVKA